MTAADRAFGSVAVVLAVERGAEFGAFDGRYAALAETMLQSLGPQLAESIRPGERLGLIAPVQVVARAKISPGAVALTDQRVVVAWCEGIALSEVYLSTCPLTEVHEVERRTRRAVLSPNLAALGFWAGTQYLELVFSTAVSERLVTAVQLGLTRAVTYGVDSEAVAPARREFGLGFDSLPHPRGAMVATVTPGSPADAAGLTVGVVLTHVAGRRVDGAEHAATVLGAAPETAAVELRWWRDGVAHVTTVEPTPQPVAGPPVADTTLATGPVATTPLATGPDPAGAGRAYELAQQMPVGALAAGMTPADVQQESAAMIEAFSRGDFEAAWRRRVELGYGIPGVGVDPASLFWLDAAAALAALHLGLRDHPLVAACCGLAASNLDRRDPGQSVAFRELEQLTRRS